MNPVLVDDRAGLVTRIVRQPRRPGMPRALISCVAHVADTTRFAAWRADPHAHGAALFDPDAAAGPALGEAMERYCGNAVASGLPRAKAGDLVAAGERTVDLAAVALYAPHQYRTRGFPFVEPTEDLPLHWIRGEDMRTGAPIWMPAAMAYLNVRHVLTDPPVVSPQYAGIAAGVTRVAAEASALEELIERDAVAVWWLGGGRALGLDPADSPTIRAVLTDPCAPDLQYSFLAIPHRTGLPVVGVLAQDRKHGLMAFGSACRAQPEQAAVKALTEALAQLLLSADLADSDSPLWRKLRTGDLRAAGLLPFRADRAYLDDYGPRWRRMVDLPANAQLYLDPRLHEPALGRLRLPIAVALDDTTAWSPPAVSSAGERRAEYVRRLAAAGFGAISVELTTSDVATAGMHVVRVCTPGLIGNAPAAFPLLGSDRVRTEARALGLSARELTPGQEHLTPLPFC